MSKDFVEEVESLGRSLLRKAKGKDVEIADKIAIFAHAVKWAAVKNKLEPDDAEGSGWGKYRQSLGAGGESGDDTQASPSKIKPLNGYLPLSVPSGDSNESRASEIKDDSNRFTDSGDVYDPSEGPKPSLGSFPVNGGSVLPESLGGERAGNGADSSSGDI